MIVGNELIKSIKCDDGLKFTRSNICIQEGFELHQSLSARFQMISFNKFTCWWLGTSKAIKAINSI